MLLHQLDVKTSDACRSDSSYLWLELQNTDVKQRDKPHELNLHSRYFKVSCPIDGRILIAVEVKLSNR